MAYKAKRINVVDDQLMASELEAIGIQDYEDTLQEGLEASSNLFEVRSIVTGIVVDHLGDEVVVDIGYKSEGYVPSAEFGEDEGEVGSTVQVMIVDIEPNGEVLLSKRQADLELGWQTVLGNNQEGDRITGKVLRKIKGGLLVDIGVPVFLPASQIDIRRATDVSEYIGQEIEAEIIKIDADRKNIVVSRRKVLEEERKKNREELVQSLNVGDLREGIVKNITDFGVFIGIEEGIDGLIHVSDLSWTERIKHPAEKYAKGDTIQAVVLKIDKENERFSLGVGH